VDLGANYIHACTKDQPVFQLAVKHKIQTAVVAGGRNFEDTEVAQWYNVGSGQRIQSIDIARMHTLLWKIDSYMTRLVRKMKPEQIQKYSMASLFEVCRKSILKRFFIKAHDRGGGGERKVPTEDNSTTTTCSSSRSPADDRILTKIEEKILYKLARRAYGYVSNLEDTSLEFVRPPPGGETFSSSSSSSSSSSRFDTDDRFGSPEHVREEAQEINSKIFKSKTTLKVEAAKDDGNKGDRFVVDGYKWLINLLADKLPIQTEREVISIKDISGGSSSSSLENKEEDKDNSRCSSSPSMAPDHHYPILVTCKDGSKFWCKRVICTLPLEILRETIFSPSLSKHKIEAMRRISTGAHNKIILRFNHLKKIFWPVDIPQFNCDDPRFQFLNLHCYGKAGIILAHIFPPYAYGYGADSQSSSSSSSNNNLEVVKEVLVVLSRMFGISMSALQERLLDYIVTRWDDESYSRGSYSYLRPGGHMQHLKDLQAPLRRTSTGENIVHFAGEACTTVGFQCVHGAYISGEKAACEVAKDLKKK